MKVLNKFRFFADRLRDCAHRRSLADARRIQSQLLASGMEDHLHLGNQLVQTYLKCGSVEDARSVFEGMSSRGRLAWTAIITAYVHRGDHTQAFWLFQRSLQEGMVPDNVTFVSVLSACSECRYRASAVHALIVETGLETEMIVANALMTVYGKMNLLERTWDVFNSMRERNVVSWTVIISAFAHNGQRTIALGLFRAMQLEGVEPNDVTFTTVLGLHSGAEALPFGKALHSQVVQAGYDSSVLVSNSLINMYSSCQDLNSASEVFNGMAEKDLITWNVIINAFAEENQRLKALEFFRRMLAEGMRPNRATFLSILNVCMSSLEPSEFVSDCIFQSGYASNVQVGNALLNLHGKAGTLRNAEQVLSGLNSHRDVISWTAMIGAYCHHREFPSALKTFRLMLQEGVRPNQVTFLAVLSSCRSLSEGVRIHSHVLEMGFEQEVDVSVALIDMYGNCGDLSLAIRAFKGVQARNRAVWNVLIAANSRNGVFLEALRLFWLMQQEDGILPDDITLNAVISACAHAGLVSRGCSYFASMKADYQLTPNPQHYSCLVDLLGRAGHLQEAEQVMADIPFAVRESIRMAFLSACNVQRDRERGSRVAERVLEIEPSDQSVYVTLSQL